MARVGTAVEADDEVVLISEEIDDFAFGLVAPLQADDTGAGHGPTYPGSTGFVRGPRSELGWATKNARGPKGPGLPR